MLRWFEALVIVAGVAVVIGGIWWATAVHEFRGRFVHRPGLIGIPENPPPATWLVTPAATYELVIPGHLAGGPGRQRHLFLQELNGKEVLVRGTRGVRRRPSGRRGEIIQVREIRVVGSS
jgi:hypothetical protein